MFEGFFKWYFSKRLQLYEDKARSLENSIKEWNALAVSRLADMTKKDDQIKTLASTNMIFLEQNNKLIDENFLLAQRLRMYEPLPKEVDAANQDTTTKAVQEESMPETITAHEGQTQPDEQSPGDEEKTSDADGCIPSGTEADDAQGQDSKDEDVPVRDGEAGEGDTAEKGPTKKTSFVHKPSHSFSPQSNKTKGR